MSRAIQSKPLILQKGKPRLRRVGSSKSDIQAGRVHHQWAQKFQFCPSSDQTYEMTYQSLICEVAIIKPIV